jgi:pimeloyl-ACP methyl ester carboxylesterase
MPHTTINGFSMHYELHGPETGEPLVLVHGYTGDITDWRDQVPEFSRTHRVLIMDHRGHGASEAPADRTSYTITQMADDVEALAAQAGFDRYHLLGHSMGGAVVQEIALRSPGRLISLTLHDTGHHFDLRGNGIVATFIEQRERLAEEKGMAAVAALPPLAAPPPHMAPERIAEMNERLARMSVDAYIGAWRGLEVWEGTEHRAKHIAVPTLVIYGDLDMPPLIESAKFLAANIPGAVLEVVPETAHSPQAERPGLFNAALRRHLVRNGATELRAALA